MQFLVTDLPQDEEVLAYVLIDAENSAEAARIFKETEQIEPGGTITVIPYVREEFT